ncbi:MAG: RNA polymerase sigma factor [Deltaproteobacteria bacterium]|nr:RNA polymerase sigma factor [Deltaproteobacteria bacterium]
MRLWPESSRRAHEVGLLARCRAREESAWRELYAAYSGSVGRYLRYLVGSISEPDLDDLVQQVFLTAVEQLEEFRADAALQTWLFAIAQNIRDRFIRGQYRHFRRGLSYSEFHPDGRDMAVDTAERHVYGEALRVAEDAIEELDVRLRMAWFLYEVEGMSFEEVSEALVLPIKTVRSRLHRARAQLVDALVSAGYGGDVVTSDEDEELGAVVPLRPRNEVPSWDSGPVGAGPGGVR